MMTKCVNGEHIPLTEAERVAITAEWDRNRLNPPPPPKPRGVVLVEQILDDAEALEMLKRALA